MKKEQNLWTEGCSLSMESSGCMTGVQGKFILSAQFGGEPLLCARFFTFAIF